jgi:hypothetical protein
MYAPWSGVQVESQRKGGDGRMAKKKATKKKKKK